MNPLSLSRVLHKFLYTSIVFIIALFAGHSTAFADGTISACGSIAVAGTYTLTQNIGSGGSCITITASGVTIDGDGHTITGNISSANGSKDQEFDDMADPGISYTLTNIVVTGTVTSGNGQVGGSSFDGGAGGAGGSITITNSTTGNITSGNGGNGGCGGSCPAGGAGGSITITNSTTGNITSGNGGNGETAGGAGGSITISRTTIDLSNKTITAGLGGLNIDSARTSSGAITLTYTTLQTNTSTYIYNASNVILNTQSIGSWNAVFNPFLGTSITAASQCAAIVLPGTYTLANDFTGNCVIPIAGITIDGDGHTITGNVSSANGVDDDLGTPGVSITIIDATIVGNITSGNGGLGGCTDTCESQSGVGGAIQLTNVTVQGNVVSGNGNGVSSVFASRGGDITLTDSSATLVQSGNGGDTTEPGGRGGNITSSRSTVGEYHTGDGGISSGNTGGHSGSLAISATNVDLNDVVITIGSVGTDGCSGGCGGNGSAGTVTLTYTTITTNTSTYIYNASNVILNTQSIGSWNAVFNPFLGTSITAASQCAAIVLPGTYTLANDFTGNCVIPIAGITIDGDGHTITGNVSSANGITNSDESSTPGVGYTLTSITVTGTVTSGNGGSADCSSVCNGAGSNGGSITLTNATVGSITSGNGGLGYGVNGGSGGSITITNTIFGSITAGNGGNSVTDGPAGNGGSVSISATNLNLLGKTVTGGSGGTDDCDGECGGNGSASTVTLTYTTILTNPSTYIYNASALSDNGTDLGPWNEVFNLYQDTTAPVLTEVTPIASTTTLANAVYHFTTSEVCEVLAEAPTSDKGTVELHVDSVVPSTDLTAYLSGIEVGGTYSFRFLCKDVSLNESNMIEVPAFTVIAPPTARRSVIGGSTSRRNPFVQTATVVPQTPIAPVFSSYIFAKNLSYKMRSVEVQELQKFLNTNGFPVALTGVASKGFETTYFGPATRAALIAFQKSKGIKPAVGFLGPLTRKVIADIGKQ